MAALPPGLEITQHFEPGLPPVLADHEKLVQIPTNLVSNAVKYSPDGGQATVDAGRIGSTVRIQVSDQGLGVPADELDSIFDRFHRVDDERRRTIEGTGLGLYMPSLELRVDQPTRYADIGRWHRRPCDVRDEYLAAHR